MFNNENAYNGQDGQNNASSNSNNFPGTDNNGNNQMPNNNFGNTGYDNYNNAQSNYGNQQNVPSGQNVNDYGAYNYNQANQYGFDPNNNYSFGQGDATTAGEVNNFAAGQFAETGDQDVQTSDYNNQSGQNYDYLNPAYSGQDAQANLADSVQDGYGQNNFGQDTLGNDSFSQDQMYAPNPAANYPVNQNVKTAKKSKKGLFIGLGVLAAVVALALAIFFILRGVKNSGKPGEITNEQLKQFIEDAAPSTLSNFDSDIPITSIEIKKQELDKNISFENRQYFNLRADIMQENDEVAIENDAEIVMLWNADIKEWAFERLFSSSPKVKPKYGVEDKQVKEDLSHQSFEGESGKYWRASGDELDSVEITGREDGEDGVSQDVTVEFNFSNIVTTAKGVVKVSYEYRYGNWQRMDQEIISFVEEPKDGAAFVFEDETIYDLWAGQYLDLYEYADTGVFVRADIPAEEPKKAMANARVVETKQTYEEGVYEATYTFDLNQGDYFTAEIRVVQTFKYNEEDKTYYLDNTRRSRISWELIKADLSGDWFGNYTDSSGDKYKLKLNMVPMEQDPNSYDVVIEATPLKGGQKGTYEATAELSKSSLRLNFNRGNWIEKSEDFYRFAFSGYLVPNQEIIQGKGFGELNLSRNQDQFSGTQNTTTTSKPENTEQINQGDNTEKTEETTAAPTTEAK